jgi:ribosome-associated translation inhibitor RaiA
VDENIELGGKIFLSGFKNLRRDELLIAKKVIGSYARKFNDGLENYESLNLHLKPIHNPESEKYELNAKLINDGKPTTSNVTDHNVFICIDSALKKIEEQIFK